MRGGGGKRKGEKGDTCVYVGGEDWPSRYAPKRELGFGLKKEAEGARKAPNRRQNRNLRANLARRRGR